MRNKKNLRGMTLIELMITVSIIAIMSTIFLLDFNSGKIKKELQMAAREVSASYSEAQNYALAGYHGVLGTDPCGFEVRWSGTTYSIVYKYKNISGICDQEAIIRSYELKNGITFSNPGNFSLSLPFAKLSAVGGAGATLSKGDDFHSVCIERDGLIHDVAGPPSSVVGSPCQ